MLSHSLRPVEAGGLEYKGDLRDDAFELHCCNSALHQTCPRDIYGFEEGKDHVEKFYWELMNKARL